MVDLNKFLGDDYLSAAHQYISAAETIIDSLKNQSVGSIYLDNPITFLICHSMELVLKAFLAYSGLTYFDLMKLEIRHNLSALFVIASQKQIPRNDEFSSLVNQLSENHKNFDYRYPRSFSGFPDDRYDVLMSFMNRDYRSLPETKDWDWKSVSRSELEKLDQKYNNEIRRYGLTAKSIVSSSNAIEAIKSQINLIADHNNNLREVA